MVAGKRKVIWNDEAKIQLKKAYEYIYQDSPQNARKVRNDIAAIAKKLSDNPGFYTLDKYKLENDGSYRAFEKHRYRISYRVLDTEIRILVMRHTSMEPVTY
jgi:plasmid stabilization system protein ParE